MPDDSIWFDEEQERQAQEDERAEEWVAVWQARDRLTDVTGEGWSRIAHFCGTHALADMTGFAPGSRL